MMIFVWGLSSDVLSKHLQRQIYELFPYKYGDITVWSFLYHNHTLKNVTDNKRKLINLLHFTLIIWRLFYISSLISLQLLFWNIFNVSNTKEIMYFIYINKLHFYFWYIVIIIYTK